MSDLPEGWEWVTADQITAPERNALAIGPFGSNLKVSDYRTEGVPLVFVRNIRADAFDLPGMRFVSPEKAESLRAHQIRNGDLLITKMGDPPGDAAVYRLEEPGIITADCIKLTPHPSIDVRYLLYAIRSPQVQHQIGEITQGVAQRKISLDRFRKHVVLPLAPPHEQTRIVAAIEEQFSRLDAATDALQRVRRNLKRMRRAVLQSAVGKQFVSPSDEGSGGHDLPGGPLTRAVTETPTVPHGWQWTKIGSVCECLDSRRVPVNREERLQRNGQIPYYGANGQVGWINDHLFDEPLVLVVEDETFTGREKPFSYKITGKSWVNNHAHVLRPRPGVNVDYLNYSLAYYPFTPLTTGTTGRRKLTQRALLAAPLVLPPEPEQDAIVVDVDRRISVVNHLDAEVDSWLKRASVCRLSILNQAFSGRLVPQHPSDEPAGTLLEKIAGDASFNGHRPTKGRKPGTSRQEASA